MPRVTRITRRMNAASYERHHPRRATLKGLSRRSTHGDSNGFRYPVSRSKHSDGGDLSSAAETVSVRPSHVKSPPRPRLADDATRRTGCSSGKPSTPAPNSSRAVKTESRADRRRRQLSRRVHGASVSAGFEKSAPSSSPASRNWSRLAYREIPVYRAKYKAAGFKPEHLRDYDDIQKIPVITKPELVAAFPDQCVNAQVQERRACFRRARRAHRARPC